MCPTPTSGLLRIPRLYKHLMAGSERRYSPKMEVLSEDVILRMPRMVRCRPDPHSTIIVPTYLCVSVANRKEPESAPNEPPSQKPSYVHLPATCIHVYGISLIQYQSDGHKKFRAIVVTSQLADPTCSPCGICRQVIREFFPLNAPVIMVGSKYDSKADSPLSVLPAALASRGLLNESLATDATGETGENGQGEGWEAVIKIMTLEELLPMSFGPEHLDMPR